MKKDDYIKALKVLVAYMDGIERKPRLIRKGLPCIFEFSADCYRKIIQELGKESEVYTELITEKVLELGIALDEFEEDLIMAVVNDYNCTCLYKIYTDVKELRKTYFGIDFTVDIDSKSTITVNDLKSNQKSRKGYPNVELFGDKELDI